MVQSLKRLKLIQTFQRSEASATVTMFAFVKSINSFFELVMQVQVMHLQPVSKMTLHTTESFKLNRDWNFTNDFIYKVTLLAVYDNAIKFFTPVKTK